jgi:hypothetical protein
MAKRTPPPKRKAKPPTPPAVIPLEDEAIGEVDYVTIDRSGIPQTPAELASYGALVGDPLEPETYDPGNDGTDEGRADELIRQAAAISRLLLARHVQIVPRIVEVRRLLVHVEVHLARQTLLKGSGPATDPRDPAPLTGILEQAQNLLAECEAIDRGATDPYGPELSWGRVDRMIGLARASSSRFFFQNEDWVPLSERRQTADAQDPWKSFDPRTVRQMLDELAESVRWAGIDVASLTWDRWVKTIQDSSQRAILPEVWTILSTATEPLTRIIIFQRFKTKPDWSILGKALAAARADGLLRNRSQKPRGYFLPHRFPHLIDP